MTETKRKEKNMSTKSHANHSAKKLLNNDGVPSKIVMDGAREQVMGKFKEAFQDATVQVQQIGGLDLSSFSGGWAGVI